MRCSACGSWFDSLSDPKEGECSKSSNGYHKEPHPAKKKMSLSMKKPLPLLVRDVLLCSCHSLHDQCDRKAEFFVENPRVPACGECLLAFLRAKNPRSVVVVTRI